MKWAFVFVALLMISAGAVRASENYTRIVLRERAVVSGGVITLEDIAEVTGEDAERIGEVSLGNAPWPGYARRVARALVEVRLASSGFDMNRMEISGPDACIVESATDIVSGERLINEAREYLLDRLNADNDEDGLSISLAREVSDVLVRSGDGPIEVRPNISNAGDLIGRVRVEMEIVRDGARLERALVNFHVSRADRVAVARRNIPRDSKLEGGYVEFTTRRVTNSNTNRIESESELRGMVAARHIPAGAIITSDMLRAERASVVVDYNQMVTLVVETSNLRVVAAGRALSRAREGESVRVKNINTDREVVGIAYPGPIVRVGMEIGQR